MTAPRQPFARITRWGVLLRYSRKALGGPVEQWDFGSRAPLLFWTRSEARAYIAERYGYIRDRPDLRAAPHGWLMPVARRCKVMVEPA